MQFEDYTIHAWAQKVPEISAHDFVNLKANIEQNGQQVPIIRHAGEIIDGRNRLKICLELGREPRFEEYAGTLPVEQYILSTNIRRNLTAKQRMQLMAIFAPVIIPQVEAEMERRGQEGLAKGGKMPAQAGGGKKSDGRADSIAHRSEGKKSYEEGHPGVIAIREALGATTEQAKHFKEIFKKAPELLPEAAERGLAKTAKEARRRRDAAKRKAAKSTAAGNGEKRLDSGAAAFARTQEAFKGKPRVQDMIVPDEAIDPVLAKDPLAFVAKYGQINLRTGTQIADDKDKDAFVAWIAALRKLKVPLTTLLEVPAFNADNWKNWFAPQIAGPLRRAEMTELFDLVAAVAAAVATGSTELKQFVSRESVRD